MNEPVYNCGCFWWMHGTKDDACDLYLPERVKARSECPLLADCRQREAYRRKQEEYLTRGILYYSVSNWHFYHAGQTATGDAAMRDLAMQNIAWNRGDGNGLLADYVSPRI